MFHLDQVKLNSIGETLLIDVAAVEMEVKEREDKDALWNRCAKDRKFFIENFVFITNPKEAGMPNSSKFLFRLRPRQVQLLKTWEKWLAEAETGLVPKSREEGASWLACAFAVHAFLFIENFRTNFGSKDREAVDILGDIDTLLEKCRFILRNLPIELQPNYPKWERDLNVMNLKNSAMNTIIKGEVGKTAGRSGRSTMYFYDEWDYAPTPKETHTALNENARCKVFISSVAGYGTYMHQQEESGDHPIFRLHWKDNPDKNHFYIDDEGKRVYPYEVKKRKEYGQANQIGYAREIDMDRSAAQEGILIPRAWIDAAFELELPLQGASKSGLDVSNDRGDSTVYANRIGSSFIQVQKLFGRDINDQVERKLIEHIAESLSFDETGVGAYAVSGLEKDPPRFKIRDLPNGNPLMVPIKIKGFTNNSRPPDNEFLPDRPNTPSSVRFKYGVDALWWKFRLRFENSFKLFNNPTLDIDPAECISFSRLKDYETIQDLKAQFSRVLYKTETLSKKIRIDKKGNSSISPDKAEACIYTEVNHSDLEEDDSGFNSFIT